MKLKDKVEVLHETKFTIKGNEPFVKYGESGIIVHLKGPYGQTHILVEKYFSGVSGLDTFRKGDGLSLQLRRVQQVPMTWWEEVIDWVKGWVK